MTTATVSADVGDTPNSDFETRVVVIDDRHDRRQLMTYVLEQAGDVIVVGYAESPVSALEAVSRLRANAVVLEVQLPAAQGLDTISALRDQFPALVIVVCSFHASTTTKQAAMDRGADGYLVKPFSLPDLRGALRSGRHRSSSVD